MSMREHQELEYGHDRDYTYGSPHLRHDELRNKIEGELRELVAAQIARTGRCRVVEVGAGHGSFTGPMTAAGATVTVTEMSRPSADYLQRRFAGDDSVAVVDDPDGTASAECARDADLLVYISVLHHIPDYLGAVGACVENLEPGGSFYSAQDPLWYSRIPRHQRRLDQGAYFAWRIFQGNLLRGISTRMRRLRGHLDQANPADMVEYHVVRDGVDEQALMSLLHEHFENVSIRRYWSAQSRTAQRVGARLHFESTFGLRATGRRPN
jgi:SAM-dependent methyltransferase